MKVKFIVLAVVLALAVGWRHFGMALTQWERPTEDWLYGIVPTAVPGASLMRGMEDSRVTYRMDEISYKELKPIGIAAQVYQDENGEKYDAVVIAGDRMESFHDQRWCFVGQGWEIVQDTFRTVKTKQHGDVKLLFLQIKRPSEPARYAAFAFKSPVDFRTSYQRAQIDFITEELKRGKPNVGYSFRFIGLTDGIQEEQFLKFVTSYLDAASESSKGLL